MSRFNRRLRGRGLFVLLCGLVALTSGCGREPQSGAVPEDGSNGVVPEPDMPEPDSTDDPVLAWSLAQEGTDSGVKWSVFVGDSSTQRLRCVSLDLDPRPPSLFPRIPNLVDPTTGETIPLPPPLAAQASGDGREDQGCAPSPSLTNMSSQPLYTLSVLQPDSGKGTSYAAGTAAPEIGQITAEFSDGTTAPAVVNQGIFIVIYPSTKMLAALRPVVPEFPDLRCSISELAHPPIPGGPPSFTSYVDGGCTGYTVEFGFGR